MANKILVNGANIQKLREEKKLTQAELGSKLGGIGSSKSARTIQRMENDSKYKCTKFMIEALAKIFEVPFEKLISSENMTQQVQFIDPDDIWWNSANIKEKENEIKKSDYINNQDFSQKFNENLPIEIDESRKFTLNEYFIGDLFTGEDHVKTLADFDEEWEKMDLLRPFKFIPTPFNVLASAVNNLFPFKHFVESERNAEHRYWVETNYPHEDKRDVKKMRWSREKMLFKGLSKANSYSIDSDVPDDEKALDISCKIIESIEDYFCAALSISDELKFQFNLSFLIKQLNQQKMSIYSKTWESKKTGYGESLEKKIFTEYHIRILLRKWRNPKVQDLNICIDDEFDEFSNSFIGVESRERIESELEKQESFLERAEEVHGDEYDYSKTNFIHMKMDVEIVCKKHGIFIQKPDYHLSGYGCEACLYEGRTETNEQD